MPNSTERRKRWVRSYAQVVQSVDVMPELPVPHALAMCGSAGKGGNAIVYPLSEEDLPLLVRTMVNAFGAERMRELVNGGKENGD